MKLFILLALCLIGVAHAGYRGWSSGYSGWSSPVIYSRPSYSSGWPSSGYSGWPSSGYSAWPSSGWSRPRYVSSLSSWPSSGWASSYSPSYRVVRPSYRVRPSYSYSRPSYSSGWSSPSYSGWTGVGGGWNNGWW